MKNIKSNILEDLGNCINQLTQNVGNSAYMGSIKSRSKNG